MDIESFLFLETEEEVDTLVAALYHFVASYNLDILKNCLILKNVDITGIKFENEDCIPLVVARLEESEVSYKSPYYVPYHPLVSLLKLLIEVYGENIDYDDVQFFEKLIIRGEGYLNAIAAYRSVGRIESPQNKPFGTGVLVKEDGKYGVLTCYHVLKDILAAKKDAWIRFDYKRRGPVVQAGKLFKLDIGRGVSFDRDLDYAFVNLTRPVNRAAAFLTRDEVLSEGEEIRLIHHPEEDPLDISHEGKIIQVGEKYILHNIEAVRKGSSGAPIFNRKWEVVAIHRGRPSNLNLDPDTTAGVPVRAIWNRLSPRPSSQEPINSGNHSTVARELQNTNTQRDTNILQELDEQRRGQLLSQSIQIKKAKIDELDIYNYRLGTEMGIFKDLMGYGKAAMCALMGNYYFLNFMIERMNRLAKSELHNLKEERISFTRGDQVRLNSRGRNNESARVRIILDKINVQSLKELFQKHEGMSIFLVVENSCLKQEEMKIFAESLWRNIHTELLTFLQEKNLCFLVILADFDVGEYPITNCTTISTPQLEYAEFSNWLIVEFRNLNFPEENIEFLTSRLEREQEVLEQDIREREDLGNPMKANEAFGIFFEKTRSILEELRKGKLNLL